MAFTAYHNVTGSSGVTVELIQPEDNTNGISSILLSNIHASASATVDLFIQDDPPSGTATSTFNIIKGTNIPNGTSLLIDDSSLLSFDGSKFGLYITVGSSDTVDVLINR